MGMAPTELPDCPKLTAQDQLPMLQGNGQRVVLWGFLSNLIDTVDSDGRGLVALACSQNQGGYEPLGRPSRARPLLD
jgi:hypothetical protein